ncbi:unnamed protein product [[Candida] boidinii]|nr:unnamed protein product [[Candida] boidinii]
MSRIIGVRREQTANIMNIQTKLFNSQFHQTNIKIITEKVRRETWKDTSFNSSIQIILNEIIQTSTDDIWKDIIDLANFKQLNNNSIGITATNNNNNNNIKNLDDDKRTTLVIDDISIIVPDCTIAFLKIVKDYIMFKIAFLNSDEQNLLGILRIFNLEINKSVLGATAKITAGLKHITAKNIAIASQLIDFIIHLLPFLEKIYIRLNKNIEINSIIFEEFSKIKQLFQNHQNELFAKLVSMMSDRVAVHSNEIKTIDWSINLPQNQVHRYMEILVKETLTISRVLQRYLPDLQYSLILSRIFEQYKRSLLDIYTQVKFKDSIEKAIMMKDIDYFREKLGDLKGYGNSGQVIWENVNALPTDEDIKMEQIMRKLQFS